MTQTVADRTKYWKVKEIETVDSFLQECCYLHATADTKTKDLYDQYVLWCRNTANEFCLIGKNKFVTMVNSLLNVDGDLIRSYRTNKHRGWQGIGLVFRSERRRQA